MSEFSVIYHQIRRLFFYLLRRDFCASRNMGKALCSRIVDDIKLSIRNARKVKCEYCGWEGNNFFVANFRSYNRYNTLCPRCNSLGRHRLLLRYLRERTPFFSREIKVLDVAPLEAFQRLCLERDNIQYLSVDLSSPLAMCKMDITALSLPDGEFDVVICYHVLEHVRDDLAGMRELYRVLADDGFALIQVPIDEELDRTIEYDEPDPKQSGHVRMYGRDYRRRLESTGFEAKEDRYAFELNQATIEKYGIIPETLYVATKPFE